MITLKSEEDNNLLFSLKNWFWTKFLNKEFGILEFFIFRHIYANCGYFVTSQL